MTPQWFAEDFLRVYTKKPQFFGLVQAGYRVVLANMPNEFDLERLETLVVPGLGSMAPTPPATEAPSTPKAKGHSRDSSFSFPCASGGPSSTTPFSNNSFTTVPPTFTPSSPSQNSKKRRNASAKRLHDDSQTLLSQYDGNPKKKQKQ